MYDEVAAADFMRGLDSPNLDDVTDKPVSEDSSKLDPRAEI